MVYLGAKNVQSEDDIQGNARPLPGRYHVIVKEVDESMEKVDKIIIEFEVLAGTTPGQEGRVVTEYFAITEKAISRLTRLALVLGLLKPGEEDRDVAFSESVGRDLVIEVEPNEYTNKDGKEVKTVRVTYLGFWSTGNEAVADVPKYSAVDGASGASGGNGVSGGNGSQSIAGPTTTQAPPAADKWAGL